jgi:hypothetical protein
MIIEDGHILIIYTDIPYRTPLIARKVHKCNTKWHEFYTNWFVENFIQFTYKSDK